MNDPLHELFAKYKKKLELIPDKPRKGKKGGQVYFMVHYIRRGFVRSLVRKVLSKVHLKGTR